MQSGMLANIHDCIPVEWSCEGWTVCIRYIMVVLTYNEATYTPRTSKKKCSQEC
jgi:hypothetical protein